MKKHITHTRFQSFSTLLGMSRFVFQYSAEDYQKQMETMNVESEKPNMDDETKAMEQYATVEGRASKAMDTFSKSEKDKVKAAREKAREEDKKNFPSDEDLDKALSTAKTEALKKLKTNYDAAQQKRTENAKAFSESMGVKLTQANRASVDDAVGKGELKRAIGEIDTGSEGPGNNMDRITQMLKIVYIEEGKAAAEVLARQMERKSEGVGDNMDRKSMNDVFGEGTFKTADDAKLTEGASSTVSGRMYGLVYVAGRAFGDSEAGKAAYAAYMEYLKAEGEKIKANKNWAEKDKAAVALMTPTEWAAQNTLHRMGLKKYAEAGGAPELLDKIESGDAKNKLKAVLDGILRGETDPKKRDAMVKQMMTDLGKDENSIASLTPADLEAYLRSKKLDGYGDTFDKLKMDKASDFEAIEKARSMGLERFKSNMKGYLSGLQLSADSKEFKDGNKDYSARVRQEYRDYIKQQSSLEGGGDLMNNLQTGINKVLTPPTTMPEVITWGMKVPGLVDMYSSAVRTGFQTPDLFFVTFLAKEKEKYKDHPQEREVDDMLSKIPAEKTKERDYLRGILLGAIGGETDPDKMRKLAEDAMKDQNGLNMDPAKLEEVDFKKNLKKFIEDRKEFFGEDGKKLGDMTQGYAAGLLYQAEQRFKDKPELLDAYKKQVKEKLDEYAKVEETKDAVRRLEAYKLNLPIETDPQKKKNTQKQIDELQSSMYRGAWEKILYPATFEKEKAPQLKEQTLAGNKDFLDKYGQADKLDKPNSEKSLTAIFGSVPKDKITDANKKAYEDKQKELAAALGKAKTPEDRLKILAQAQDFTAHFVDGKAPEDRFQTVAEQYTLTVKIADTAKDKKKSDAYIKAMAKALGYKDDDQKVKDALAAITDAAESKRAGVLADQVVALYAGADAAKRPPIAYTKEAYDTYSAYIAEAEAKAAQAKAAAKKPAPGAGGAGGSGSGGGPKPGPGVGTLIVGGGGPKPGPAPTPGDKDKPAPKETKETMDADKLLGVLKTTVTGVLAKYSGVEFDKPAADLVKEIKGALEAAAGALKGKYDCSKITVPVSYKDASGVSLSLTPPETYALDATAINEEWVRKNMKEKQPEKKEETKEDVEKQVGSYISKFNAELARLTNGVNFNDKTTGAEVMQAIRAGWKGGAMPADLLAKVAKYPDFKASLKPEYWFAHRDVLFSNGQKQVTIRMKYRADGTVWFQPTDEKTPDYLKP